MTLRTKKSAARKDDARSLKSQEQQGDPENECHVDFDLYAYRKEFAHSADLHTGSRPPRLWGLSIYIAPLLALVRPGLGSGWTLDIGLARMPVAAGLLCQLAPFGEGDTGTAKCLSCREAGVPIVRHIPWRVHSARSLHE